MSIGFDGTKGIDAAGRDGPDVPEVEAPRFERFDDVKGGRPLPSPSADALPTLRRLEGSSSEPDVPDVLPRRPRSRVRPRSSVRGAYIGPAVSKSGL